MLTFLLKEGVNYASYSATALRLESRLSMLEAIGSRLENILFALKKAFSADGKRQQAQRFTADRFDLSMQLLFL